MMKEAEGVNNMVQVIRDLKHAWDQNDADLRYIKARGDHSETEHDQKYWHEAWLHRHKQLESLEDRINEMRKNLAEEILRLW